ncbi:conserved hypothetical protein [Planktothrix serta PCC 8927]|uniref:Uncharacterized protein n=1 Tax=Planktothrix serta PCC 8927 TaxID=671068 RepID=A0A7Z9E0Y9_9CYAN|nr:hypothetical protein [Planktothrix serta]VXD20272.1 conserved hypothetical protein [Planktothrix serta PCC 8927]
MEILLAYYTVGALASFSVCLKAFVEDSTTPLTDQTSWGVLAFTTVFWPITIPISWLELVTKPETTIVQPNFHLHPVPALPKRVNSSQPRCLPLGYLLRQAGLVTEFQIKVALQVQKMSLNHLRLGDILVAQGWIEPETIDFFAEHLPNLYQHPHKKPLAEYLKIAKLLDDQQINQILIEQAQTDLEFGELAVQKGWVKQDTINLILHYLEGQSQRVLSC